VRPAARALLAVAALLAAGAASGAGREPVVSQVALPHGYYWRELYVPQLTTGPSSAAFLPSGDELIYSMEGSLWRQKIGTEDANEITHAQGSYDYQPDISPDGRSVVFTRYDGKAFELWRRDLEGGAEHALTANAGVNLEPRISPDGRQIVFVSTAGTGHFNLKIADLAPAGLSNERYLVAPRESRIDRYYYSTHDHTINPSWSPDGQRVYYVTNAEIPWGTGWICSIAVAGGEPVCLTKAPARDFLGRAARGRPGRKAHSFLELCRRAVAPALAHHNGRRRAAAADLWRIRSSQRPLVAEWQAHRLHQQ
jgi:dipeptidyl aminopeptidase/acylaminoacyl peptidase